MSDENRKDFSTKIQEEVTPDTTKSTQQKIKETWTDTTDRISRGLQRDEDKSTTQALFDKTQRAHDNEAHNGAANSIGDKVKNALGLGNNNSGSGSGSGSNENDVTN